MPTEVNAEMSAAGHQYYQVMMQEHGDFTPTGMYLAMLAAAPEVKP